MQKISSRRKDSAIRSRSLVGYTRLAAAAVLAMFLAALSLGCGLQNEQANSAIESAAKHQAQAEALLARIQAFPNDWASIFSAPRSQDQLDKANQLVKARQDDVKQMEKELDAARAALVPIRKLSVEQKVKEYAKLKMEAIGMWSEYAMEHLEGIFKEYGSLVNQIAQNWPQSELNKTAQTITAKVKEGSEKLNECRSAEKQAEDFYNENKVGP